MDYENIIAGLSPGGANKVYEARILICFLLNSVDKPLSKTDINNIMQYQSLVNYFTLSQAFNDLIEDEQIVVYKDFDIDENENISEKKYILTKRGQQTSKVFKDTIGVTVRDKLSSAASKYLKDIKSLQDNIVKIEKVVDGYMVACRVKDIGSDLITINLFSPDKETAELIKKNFINKSLQLYQNIFDFLTS
ncbi:MAG: DUF4364 family protein [Oscillospiraceae bacterium]|nr:DUF4364 family protein [Oscillospiraceae bacterium]